MNDFRVSDHLNCIVYHNFTADMSGKPVQQKNLDLTCVGSVTLFAFLPTPLHFHPMLMYLFQTCIFMRKQLNKNAILVWQCVLIVPLRSLCWMYMINFQVVKTCHNQIRRKNMSLSFIGLLRSWFMGCLSWRQRWDVMNVLLRLSVCLWERVSQCIGHMINSGVECRGGWVGCGRSGHVWSLWCV